MAEHIETDPHSAEGDAYRWALRASALSLAVIAITGTVVAGMLRGGPGVWGAVAGVGLAAVGALVTQVAMVVGYRRSPNMFASIVGGSWLAKMFIIVIGLLVLTGVSGLDRPSFGVVAMLGVVVTLAIDVFAVIKARVPYVIPMSKSKSP